MSVDKFGRYSEFGTRSGKRGSLPLTPDGDYDISNKRLKFVNDPKDDKDAINWKTLLTETSSALKLQGDAYNANSHRISNVAKPLERFDSVNKDYLLYYTNTHFLKLTDKTDKSYNAQNRKIINIAAPENDTDSVHKKYLHSVIPSKTSDAFSFFNLVLRDIGYPKDEQDAVNLKYIREHCIIHDVDKIDCKQKFLSNVKDGVNKDDVATKAQVDHIYNITLDFIKKRVLFTGAEFINCRNQALRNVGKGELASDAATIGQIMDSNSDEWIAKNKRISGVNAGVDPRDVTTVQQMKGWCIGKDEENPDVYTCHNKEIKNVKDPTTLNSVVTVNYLARVLGVITMELHNLLVDKNIDHHVIGSEEAQQRWIDKHIIAPFFIDPTKYRESNPDLPETK